MSSVYETVTTALGHAARYGIRALGSGASSAGSAIAQNPWTAAGVGASALGAIGAYRLYRNLHDGVEEGRALIRRAQEPVTRVAETGNDIVDLARSRMGLPPLPREGRPVDAAAEPQRGQRLEFSESTLGILWGILNGDTSKLPRASAGLIMNVLSWVQSETKPNGMFRVNLPRGEEAEASATLEHFKAATGKCVELLKAFTESEDGSLVDVLKEVKEVLKDFHPLLLGMVEMPTFGIPAILGIDDEAAAHIEELSFEQTRAIQLMNRKAGVDRTKSFRELRQATNTETKRFKKLITLYSCYQTATWFLGGGSSLKELDLELRRKLDQKDIEPGTAAWRTEYEKLKAAHMKKFGDQTTSFGWIIRKIEAEKITDDYKYAARFQEILQNCVSARKDINPIKRFFIHILIPIVQWFISLFGSRLTDGAIAYIKDQIHERQADRSKAVDKEVFNDAHEAMDDVVRAYEAYSREEPMADGKIYGTPDRYIKAKLTESRPDYAGITSAQVRRMVPDSNMMYGINSVIRDMMEWTNDTNSTAVMILCNMVTILPIALLWLINNLFVRPIDAMATWLMRSITNSILMRNNVIEFLVHRDSSSLDESEFGCAIQELTCMWFEQLYETLSDRATKEDGDESSRDLKGLDPQQIVAIKKSIRGFLRKTFKLADLAELTTREEIREYLHRGSVEFIATLPQELLDRISMPTMVDNFVDLILVAVSQSCDPKNAELYLGSILSAANMALTKDEGPVDREALDALRERRVDIGQRRDHLLSRILQLSVKRGIRKSLEKAGVAQKRSARKYVKWLKAVFVEGNGDRPGKCSVWKEKLDAAVRRTKHSVEDLKLICADVDRVERAWRKEQEKFESDEERNPIASDARIKQMHDRFTTFIERLVELQEQMLVANMHDSTKKEFDELLSSVERLNAMFTSHDPSSAPDVLDYREHVEKMKVSIASLKRNTDNFPKFINQFLRDAETSHVPMVEEAINATEHETRFKACLDRIEACSADYQLTKALIDFGFRAYADEFTATATRTATPTHTTLEILKEQAREKYRDLTTEAERKRQDIQKLNAYDDDAETGGAIALFYHKFEAEVEAAKTCPDLNARFVELKDAAIEALVAKDDEDEANPASLAGAVAALKPKEYIDVQPFEISGLVDVVSHYVYQSTKARMHKVISAIQDPQIAARLIESVVLKV